MLEHDMLRQVLEERALHTAGALGFPVTFDNSTFKPPKDGSLWAEFWFETGKTQATMGGGPQSYERTSGVLQFTLKIPENKGTGLLTKMGGRIKAAWNRRQWQVPPDGYVSLDAISVQPHPKPLDGNAICIVDTTFWFHHRNPDAPEHWQ